LNTGEVTGIHSALVNIFIDADLHDARVVHPIYLMGLSLANVDQKSPGRL
jgi:hypothetical protein